MAMKQSLDVLKEKNHDPEIIERMRNEAVRLASFLEYPEDAPVIPSALVRSGFYYKRRQDPPYDEVTCYSCGCKVCGWEPLDDPYERHREANSNCSMLRGNGEDNVPFGPPQPAQTEPRRSDPVDGVYEPDAGDTVETVALLGQGSYSMALPLLQRQPTAIATENNNMMSMPWLSDSSSSTDQSTIGNRPGLVRGPPSTRQNRRSTNSLVYAMTEQERRRELKRERMRLATFNNWPVNAAVAKEVVAKAGFYHIGPGDRVRCAFCYNVLRMWETGDIPENEHRRYFPRCPLLLAPHACGNIPADLDGEPLWSRPSSDDNALPINARPAIQGTLNGNMSDGLGIVRSQPRDTRHAVESTRLRTFDTWPAYAALSPERLAEAGFYYLGVTDSTRCFFCDVLLRLWKASDDPWEEHARWQPACGFLRLKKGEAFIEEVTRKYATAQAIVAATQNNNTGMVSDPLVDRRTLFDTMKSEMVQQAIQMGFHREMVSKMVEQRLIASEKTISPN